MSPFDRALGLTTEYVRTVVQRREQIDRTQCFQLAQIELNDSVCAPAEADTRSQLMELAFRNCLAECHLDTAASAHLIDCALEFFDDCTPAAALLEEWAESMAVSKLHIAFQYLTSRAAQFLREISSTRGHGLVVLRLCNEMLRRLSKAKHSVECGHVILFLSSVFPPTERSALNLRGEFNIENVTPIDPPTSSDAEYQFYAEFWKLQGYMHDPASALEPKNWQTIQSTLNALLGRWETNQPLSHGARLSYPKHLSNRGLFEMQMVDLDFRNTILTQLCIFLDHLMQARSSNQPKPLSKEQESDLGTVMQRVQAILLKDNPTGHVLMQVRTMLASERSWVSWKMQSCPSFELEPILEYNSPLTIPDQPVEERTFVLPDGSGCALLDDLWKSATGPAEIAESVPGNSFETFIAPLMEQLDPNEGIEEEYRLSHTEEYRWRLLRLLVSQPMRSPAFVAAGANGPQLDAFLESDNCK